jgi:ribosomal protein L11 methyltransferase
VLVHPPWERPEPARGAREEIAIEIDPGMAFGTGTHETTSLCLAAMRDWCDAHPSVNAIPRKAGESGRTLHCLDVGTGSGILAIYAAMRGMIATAVEIDADAARSAAQNIYANDTEEHIDLVSGDILVTEPVWAPYHLIVANLTSGLLKKLLPRLRELLAPAGTLLLSGILDAQEAEMREALEGAGFADAVIRRKGEWLLLETRDA